MLKRICSFLLALAMLIGMLPMMTTEAEAATLTVSEMRTKYPHGKYWNHAGSSNNNQNGFTSTPCSCHGRKTCGEASDCTCNGFTGGSSVEQSWQCMGYAEQLGYLATGYNPRSNANGWTTYTSSSALDNLKPGDIVRYKNNGHSIYVTGVSGDTVTYTDCNSDGHCIIRWDVTISKSTLRSTFTHLRSAPFSVSSGTTSCSCSTSYAGEYICTSRTTLNIRNGHGSSYGVIGSIPANEIVTVTKASGTSDSDWAHVTYNGVSGYASMQYLEKKPTSTLQIHVSVSSVSLVLGSKDTVSFDFWFTGSHPNNYKPGGAYNISDGCISATVGNSETVGRYTVTVTGLKVGSDVMVLKATDTVTGNVITSVQIPITVSNGSYSVSYNANGGSGAPGNQTKIYGKDLTLSSTKPTRSGYTFLGWSTSSTATSAAYQPGSTFTSNANTTLYAVWKNNATYTVSYNANGGTGAPSGQTKAHGTDLTLSSTKPTRTGYVFQGWAISSGATSATYQPGGKFTTNANTTLYAVWKPKTLTITFHKNDGKGTNVTQTFTYGVAGNRFGYNPDGTSKWDKNGKFAGWEMDGYVQNGWTPPANTTDWYGTFVEVKDSWIDSWYPSITLWAVWLPTYTVTYDANGGSGTTPASSHVKHTAKELTKNGFTREGYTFAGWATSPAGEVVYADQASVKNLTSTPNGNVTLYAVWKANQYTVTYNANGGTGAPVDQIKTHGTALTLSSAVPDRMGSTFLGWSTSSTASSATYLPGGSYTNNSDATLYAVWQSSGFAYTHLESTSFNTTILFADGYTFYYLMPSFSGKVRFESTGSLDTRIYLYDVNGTQLASNDDSGVGNNFLLDYTVTSGKQYYIKVNCYGSGTGTINFTGKRLYDVTYSANGGSGAPSSQTKVYGTDAVLSSTVPTRTGYTFLGWATSSNATSTTYQPGGSYTANANATLYAVWKKDLVIATQPKSVTANAGKTAAFQVVANGEGLSYQWQWRKNSSSAWAATTVSGNKTATISVPATTARNGYQYRCKITDAYGNVAYSNAATLTVKAGITISTQPVSVTANVGNTATFKVVASGSSLKYQWQWRKNSSSTWATTTVSGNKTATISVPATTARNGYQYRCKITDAYGNIAYSNAATLTVKSGPVISAQPKSVTADVGDALTFKVSATGTGLTYQWQYRTSSSGTWKVTTLSGAKTATLKVTASTVRNGYQYRCKITDANGKIVYSSAATLTVR